MNEPGITAVAQSAKGARLRMSASGRGSVSCLSRLVSICDFLETNCLSASTTALIVQIPCKTVGPVVVHTHSSFYKHK